MVSEFEDELAREAIDLLMTEAARAQAGPVDREKLLARLKVRREGASAEDRFVILLDWLGNCSLVHRMDQLQMPRSSRGQYRLPDLLAVFDYGGRRVPALIEVKSTARVLWTQQYLDRKRRYAELVGLPLLLAWYHWPTGFWSLCDLSALQKRPSGAGYELPLTTALEHSLLSLLAGDFSYSLVAGLALRVHMEMTEPAEMTSGMPPGGITADGLLYPGPWRGVVREAYFDDGHGKRRTSLGHAGMILFLGADQIPETTGEGRHLVQTFSIPQHAAQFAHRVLPIAAAGLSGVEGLQWRRYLRHARYVISGPDLYSGAREAQTEGIVERILRWSPKDMPSWLPVDAPPS